ncbi:hypothetical protein WICPIJ_008852 [Wickerhamomyces pijperi]|uniref:5'-3' DNA helicase ZGRF1-like N-terminal domain-containing protein n=1 Tax=Wickerhamomyces pijperi TaxID=599730 RepID=A0A9P8PTW6_WICPI|nr:hypothetical protein WICPIJ_008852 [Wickerhamomyces pijperi]
MSQLSQPQVISEVDEYIVLYTQEPHKKRPKYHDGFLRHYKYNSKLQVVSSSNAVVTSEFKLGLVINEGDEIKVGSVLVNVEALKSQERRDISGVIGKRGTTSTAISSVITPAKTIPVSTLSPVSAMQPMPIGAKRRRVGLSKSDTPSKRLAGATQSQVIPMTSPRASITPQNIKKPLISNQGDHTHSHRTDIQNINAPEQFHQHHKSSDTRKAMDHLKESSRAAAQSHETLSLLSEIESDNGNITLETLSQNANPRSKKDYSKPVPIPRDLSSLMSHAPERPKLKSIRIQKREHQIKTRELEEIAPTSTIQHPIKITEIGKDGNTSSNRILNKKQVPISKMISNLNNQVTPVKSVFETFRGVESPKFNAISRQIDEEDPESDGYEVLWDDGSYMSSMRNKDQKTKYRFNPETPSKTNVQSLKAVREQMNHESEEDDADDDNDEIVATPSLELQEREVFIKTKTHDFKDKKRSRSGKVYRISEL